VPFTSHDSDARVVRKGGKRIYIVKDHDHDRAVVRTVPVGVCAAPLRVELAGPVDGAHGPTCPVPVPEPATAAASLDRPRRIRRVRDVVRHPLATRLGR
jgi:hypothetical protein